MASYSKEAAIKIIEKERVMVVLGVAWMIREIVKSKGDLSSVQSFAGGGAPSAKELASECSQRNPEAISSVGYGMTELNGAAIGAYADDYHAKPTSVGYPHLGIETIIVDMDTETRLPNGQRGELWIRGPGRAKVCVCVGSERRVK